MSAKGCSRWNFFARHGADDKHSKFDDDLQTQRPERLHAGEPHPRDRPGDSIASGAFATRPDPAAVCSLLESGRAPLGVRLNSSSPANACKNLNERGSKDIKRWYRTTGTETRLTCPRQADLRTFEVVK